MIWTHSTTDFHLFAGRDSNTIGNPPSLLVLVSSPLASPPLVLPTQGYTLVSSRNINLVQNGNVVEETGEESCFVSFKLDVVRSLYDVDETTKPSLLSTGDSW